MLLVSWPEADLLCVGKPLWSGVDCDARLSLFHFLTKTVEVVWIILQFPSRILLLAMDCTSAWGEGNVKGVDGEILLARGNAMELNILDYISVHKSAISANQHEGIGK